MADRLTGYKAHSTLGRPARVVDRRRYLVERAAGKRVVHLGYADERLARTRAGSGDPIHQEMAPVVGAMCGVDISKQALDEIARAVPGHFVLGGVECLGLIDLPHECDLVVAAELFEHPGRPAGILSSLRGDLQQTSASTLLTMPNPYPWTQFAVLAAARHEEIHPDDVRVYSPVTLRHALNRARLDGVTRSVHAWPDKIGGRGRTVGILDRALRARQPWLGVGLLAEV